MGFQSPRMNGTVPGYLNRGELESLYLEKLLTGLKVASVPLPIPRDETLRAPEGLTPFTAGMPLPPRSPRALIAANRQPCLHLGPEPFLHRDHY